MRLTLFPYQLSLPIFLRWITSSFGDGVFDLKLANLATNRNYIIESSYEPGRGSWAAVHTFIASAADQEWSDPIGKDVNMVFYRIREGAY